MPALVVNGSGEEAGLQAGEAAHAPLGVGDLTDEFEFEGVGGLDVGFEGGELAVEVGGSSPGRTVSRARSPCLRAFFATRDLPSSVRGPVDFLAFLRLALICAFVGMIIIPFVGAVERLSRPTVDPVVTGGSDSRVRWGGGIRGGQVE